jgi:hypothetical protein
LETHFLAALVNDGISDVTAFHFTLAPSELVGVLMMVLDERLNGIPKLVLTFEAGLA